MVSIMEAKNLWIAISIVAAVLILESSSSQMADAQPVNITSSQAANMNETIKQQFSRSDIHPSYGIPVEVRYESPTTVIIRGDLIYAFEFNKDLWKAMDLLKNQHGYKLQQIMTSGVGSEGNPTVVYILMVK